MKAVEIKKDIYWVGALDWAVRDFHGYETPRGTTYNNYLIMDDEITLVDTVKHDFAEVMLKNIRAIVDPASIKHVIINHIENDHVTSLDAIMALTPKATIYISEKGKKGIERFYDISNWNVKVVKTGDVLKIGKRTLHFIETPMLHWPDSMVTYAKEDKLLFSQDAFGQHIASMARFDDEFIGDYSEAALRDAVVDYYANILMPFGAMIKSKITEIQNLGLEIDMIAPDHGVIWRKDPAKVFEIYMDMANSKAEDSALIVYDTMWGSTENMIVPIAEGIRAEGVCVKIIKLRATPMSVAIKEFWKARGTLVGSPTLNNIAYPSIAEFLTHIRGLRPKDRLVGAFGSYGWGGGAVKEIYEEYKRIGLELFEPGIQVLYRPSKADEESCFKFGQEFAKRLKEYHTKF
ncbi:MAG: FprA family A-type flavoprotein [Desulfuromonadales bacterium]|nr:FprA family A-type flavoprotein [Desulfuromonadales bacterium]